MPLGESRGGIQVLHTPGIQGTPGTLETMRDAHWTGGTMTDALLTGTLGTRGDMMTDIEGRQSDMMIEEKETRDEETLPFVGVHALLQRLRIENALALPLPRLR
jgi:hypothetical protein